MKRLLIFTAMTCAFSNMNAQDVLITQDGELLNVYGLEISDNAVFYKTEDKTDAPIQRIGKEKILMVKRKDGKKYKFDNNDKVVDSGSPAKAAIAASPGATAETNRQRIEQYNSILPEFKGKPKDKEAKRLFCAMGYGADSQLTDDNVEITTESGIWDTQNVKGRNISTLMASPSLATVLNIGTRTYNPVFVVKIKNKSNKTIYIDLGNSFFIRDDNSTAYYIPSSVSNSSVTSSGVGVNLGAVAGALGVGGAVGELAGGVNVGGGKQGGSVSTTYSQRVVAIPPMSTKALSAQPLFLRYGEHGPNVFVYAEKSSDDLFLVPHVNLKNANNKNIRIGETVTYTEQNTPMKFGTYISYSFSENLTDTQNLKVNYFLKSVTGFHRTPGGEIMTYAYYLDHDIPSYSFFIGFVGIHM